MKHIMQRIRDLCDFPPLLELAIMAVITIAIVCSRAAATNIDVDRIITPTQVHTEVSVQQERCWIVVEGYYELHAAGGYVTLDVTDAENATSPLIPWFSCRTADDGLSVAVEQDPEGDDEQFASWSFACPPTATAWYFRLTLWVNDVPVDQEFFFSGVEHYRP